MQENIKYASAVSEYVRNIHVFNWNGNEKLPLWQANIVWRRYLACFERTKTLLLEFMPDGRIESLAEEAEALAKITSDIWLKNNSPIGELRVKGDL